MIKLPKNEKGPFARAVKEKRLLQWGEEEWNIVEPLLKKKRTCIDIGAHVGLTTLRYAEHFEDVFSFEPIYHEELIENTKHLDNVHVEPFAVGDIVTDVKMQVNSGNTGTNLVYSKSTELLANSRKERGVIEDDLYVKQVPLDIYKFDTVDFIKIDTEGYNMPVLIGGEKLLKGSNSPSVVQIEMSQNEKENKEVKNFLQKCGYRLHTTTRNKPKDQMWVKE